MLKDEQIQGIFRELSYHTSRSGGKGGQNVNKVETKVEIEFDVTASAFLSPEQKSRILASYTGLIDDKFIKMTGNRHRTQLENKEEARKKLISLLNKLLKPVKKRLATRPSKSSRKKKMEDKKRKSEKKDLRKKIF
jgi:ribosome-associated protein